jgi:hypothetical protein
MPRERRQRGRPRALKDRAANSYGEGDAAAAAGSVPVSVYASCGTNPTSLTGQYENQALPTMFPTGTGPNTRESDELLR